MVGRTYLVSQYAISMHWLADVSLTPGLRRLAGKVFMQLHKRLPRPPPFQMSVTLLTQHDFFKLWFNLPVMTSITGLGARGIAVMLIDPVASRLTMLQLVSTTGPYCCYKSTKNCLST